VSAVSLWLRLTGHDRCVSFQVVARVRTKTPIRRGIQADLLFASNGHGVSSLRSTGVGAMFSQTINCEM